MNSENVEEVAEWQRACRTLGSPPVLEEGTDGRSMVGEAGDAETFSGLSS